MGTRARPERCDAARARTDPPVLRCRWVLAAPRSRAAFVEELRARSGWDEATVARLLVHGGVHLDGRPYEGAALPARLPAGTRVDLHALAWEPASIALRPAQVLASGPDWIALDKPAGVPTQRTKASARVGLEVALRAWLGADDWVAVHRLDRETSGVCLFARGRAAAARLGRAFRDGRVRRRYLALVAPAHHLPRRFAASGWMGRALHPTRYAAALRPGAGPDDPPPRPGDRWSATRFARLGPAGERALVLAAPRTGRTHQIRVHLASRGAPIVGDPVYGGAPAPRLQLHAASLAWWDGSAMRRVRAPLPPDLEPAFAALAAAVAGAGSARREAS